MENAAVTNKTPLKINSNAPGQKPVSPNSNLDKDAFLKLLVTQLRHQDPTQPMNDREFIAQIAQFSTLEQMTAVNASVQTLSKSSKASEAFALLGKKIQGVIAATGQKVEGVVSKVFFKDDEVRLVVDNMEIGLADIYSVSPVENKNKDLMNAGQKNDNNTINKNIKTAN